MVYGKLPPETKLRQASLFNSGERGYLVATDAIGMGLNLSIRRIVFTTLFKFEKEGSRVQIPVHELKQIAGRAGRLVDEGGLVGAFRENHLHIIKKVLEDVNSQLQHSETGPQPYLELKPIEDQKKARLLDQIDPEMEAKEYELEAESNLESQQQKHNQESPLDPRPLIEKLQFSRHQREIKRATLFPSFSQIEQFVKNIETLTKKEFPFSSVLQKMESIARVGGLYKTQNFTQLCEVSLG